MREGPDNWSQFASAGASHIGARSPALAGSPAYLFLRPGADGDPKSSHAANYDESNANHDLKLPDPLLLNNGKKVTSVKAWWKKRRPEIVEDFDRDVYGRMPKNTPKVNWEVISTTRERNGEVPVISRRLVGHVDNSAYPLVTANID